MKKTALIIFSIIFLAGVLVVLSACSIKLPIIKQTPKIVNEVSKENNALAGVKNSEASAHQPSDLIANCDTDLNAPYENFCKTTEDCRALWKNICPSSETINFKGGKFDAKTFEMICDRYSTLWDAVVKDKNGVYLASTTQITGSDGKAKFNVDWIMVNSKTFKNLNCSYFIDNNQVLYAELPDFQVIFTNVLGADAITFETISSKTPSVTSNQYAKDKNHVYYAGLVITGADPSTFKILNSNYSEDKNNVYLTFDSTDYPWNNQKVPTVNKIENVDIKTFKILQDFVSMDKNNVYWGMNILKGVDVKTFRQATVEEKNRCHGDYIDKNYCYIDGQNVGSSK